MSVLRKLAYPELEKLVSWAREEGWEPGVNDAQQFWAYDPEGFLACEEGGQFAGGGAIIRHSDEYGFMGLFIVAAQHRGHGLGRKLWLHRRDTLLERLAPNGAIGLDGVDAMVPFYAAGGFVQATRHRRFCLRQPGERAVMASSAVPLSGISDEALSGLDRQCFPADRTTFLRRWSEQASAKALAIKNGEQVLGFGVIRRCTSGWRIGPLFAESVQVADALFNSLSESVKDDSPDDLPIFVDVPDANQEGIKWVIDQGLEEVFGCERMYYGKPPEIAHHKIFGVTTLEIG
ncbi:MAG: GNAT family N-acetyltransferase [Rubripirellula sp.]|nr:GNAT family N-acetyltransferase [Rubripirellula sp.]